MKRTALAATLLLLIFSSCSNFRSEIKDMNAVRNAVQTRINFKDVDINIQYIADGKLLNVSLVNSPYNDSSEVAKQSITDSIAVACAPCLHDTKLNFTGGNVLFTHKVGVGLVGATSSQSYPM